MSDLAEALLDTKQGEYLETVAAKFNNVTVAPVTMRGGKVTCISLMLP